MSDILRDATARPWIDVMHESGKKFSVIADDTDKHNDHFAIAAFHGPDAEQNAALARAAVNSYEPMLAALEAMVAGKHYHKASDGDPDTCHRCGENFRSSKHFRGGESEASLIDDAKAAIAIAKGETQ